MKVLIILGILAFANSQEVKTRDEQKVRRVLFIGNSMIFYYKMYKIVQDIAKADGHKLWYQNRTQSGWTLKQHWEDDLTHSKIINGSGKHGKRWDFVVINEQSTKPAYPVPKYCDGTFQYASKLNDLIKQHNPEAKILWYMTWGHKNGTMNEKNRENYPWMRTYEGMQEAIRRNYMETACSLRPAQVAPVGLAFKKYKEKHGEDEFLKLSQMDKNDHHSRLRGSYLSACVHYNMIFGEKCTGNDFLAHHTKENDGKYVNYELSEITTRKLQKVADEITGTEALRNDYIFEDQSQCLNSLCDSDYLKYC